MMAGWHKVGEGAAGSEDQGWVPFTSSIKPLFCSRGLHKGSTARRVDQQAQTSLKCPRWQGG